MNCIVALDFETTGTVPGFPNEPWQVGIVPIADKKIDLENAFETLLRISPDRPFNKYAPGRHAQLRDTLADAPALHDAWQSLAERLSGRYIIAHNIGTERTLLKNAAPLHTFGPWIDTLALAKKVWPGLKSYALEDLTAALDLRSRLDALLPRRAPHDAFYDAAACALLFIIITTLPGWNTLTPADLSRISCGKH